MFEVPKHAILHCCKWHYINTSVLLRDFSARHSIKEFSAVFSLCRLLTSGGSRGLQEPVAGAGSSSL